MDTTRRGFTVAIVSLASLSGCSEGLLSDENTPIEDFDVTDIELVNEQAESIEVTVTATADSETEFDETATIEAEENRMFDDPLADDTSYTITVTVNDELSKEYDWSPETRDDSGVRVLIDSTEIEFEGITA
ncbi:hypothetical protein [Halosimplex halobium]|uniref:hypothetical protein n=1 Tax=Halosimplex halobium TaxID=3396618 RepID=UPI003F57D726